MLFLLTIINLLFTSIHAHGDVELCTANMRDADANVDSALSAAEFTVVLENERIEAGCDPVGATELTEAQINIYASSVHTACLGQLFSGGTTDCLRRSENTTILLGGLHEPVENRTEQQKLTIFNVCETIELLRLWDCVEGLTEEESLFLSRCGRHLPGAGYNYSEIMVLEDFVDFADSYNQCNETLNVSTRVLTAFESVSNEGSVQLESARTMLAVCQAGNMTCEMEPTEVPVMTTDAPVAAPDEPETTETEAPVVAPAAAPVAAAPVVIAVATSGTVVLVTFTSCLVAASLLV